MEKFNESASTYFYVIGLSYKKADAHLRGEFSLDHDAKTNLLGLFSPFLRKLSDKLVFIVIFKIRI